MTTRSVGIGEMFGWVPATFGLVKRNFGAMAVATLITLLFGLLMAVPIGVYVFTSLRGLGSPGVPIAPPQLGAGFWTTYGLTILVATLLMPPLLAGWFRLCEAADRGAQPSGSTVLSPYRDGGTWVRVLCFALIGVLLYLLVGGLMFLAFGGVFSDMMAMQAAQQAALATGGTPPPPNFALVGKLMLAYAVLMPVLVFLQFVYMVGLAEVGLRPTGALTAFQLAFSAVLRNALKLLLLLFALWMGAALVVLVVVLVIGLLAAVLAFISPVLAFIVLGLFELVLIMVMYPLMFSGHFYMWKSLLGGGTEPVAVAA